MATHNILFMCSQKKGGLRVSPRTGRPTEDPKKNQYRIRLSDKETEMLNYCCEQTGLSKSDIVRRGIEKVYQELQNEK